MAVTVASLNAKLGLDKSNFDKGLSGASSSLGSFASGLAGKLQGATDAVAARLGGLALNIGKKLGGGLLSAAKAGFEFNDSMEQASAKINAFTKNGGLTADILKTIQTEANKTPFSFQEMVNAAAGLLPVTKASGESLDELIKLSEILAASNPAEGLEGGAFALKEALGGDFQSLIERFNLPRQYIKKLAEEGTPALEIVSKAMKQMGLDTDLVSGLANTAQGRWSTFSDSLSTLAGIATKPIFDAWSEGLGSLNGVIANSNLQSYAEQVAGGFSRILGVIKPLIEGNTAFGLQTFQSELLKIGFSPEQVSSITDGFASIQDSSSRISKAFSKMFGEDDIDVIGGITSGISNLAWALEKVASAAEIAAGLMDQWNEITSTVGVRGYFKGIANYWTEGAFGGGGAAPQTATAPAATQTYVPATIQMDGRTVGSIVGGYQGQAAANYGRMGGVPGI